LTACRVEPEAVRQSHLPGDGTCAAKTYELAAVRRFGNRMVTAMLTLGLGPGSSCLLTVAGQSGLPRTTPVAWVEGDGRWLAAPYRPVGWVKNARAAGQVTLRRGRRRETVTVTEVGANRIVRPFFDVPPSAPVEDFAARADRHPVPEIGGQLPLRPLPGPTAPTPSACHQRNAPAVYNMPRAVVPGRPQPTIPSHAATSDHRIHACELGSNRPQGEREPTGRADDLKPVRK
jgi:hypothetical protein